MTIPDFADQVGMVNLPASTGPSSGTVENFEESLTTFTDAGGNGNIPTPPSGYTAKSYIAAFISPANTINFKSSDIVITASAPCELQAGNTYVVFVYANGGALSHQQISTNGFGTAPIPATATTLNGNFAITFTINLGNLIPSNEQPSGTGLETVVASKP